MNSPFSVAEGTLAQQDYLRGMPGMTSKVPPGANSLTDPLSNAAVNIQPFSNQVLAQQGMVQNIESAAPQAAANAMRGVGAAVTAESNATTKAIDLRERFKAEALYANQSGANLFKMNEVMGSNLEGDIYRNRIANGQALAMGINPELGAEVAAKVRYL
jgi:hypothetical protein